MSRQNKRCEVQVFLVDEARTMGTEHDRALFVDWDERGLPEPPMVEASRFKVAVPADEALEVGDGQACETAYAVCNSYPAELHCEQAFADVVARYRADGRRSLSVGDVVVVEGRAYMCAGFGFRRLVRFSVAELRGGPE